MIQIFRALWRWGREVCPWATREGRAREGRGTGCGGGRNEGRGGKHFGRRGGRECEGAYHNNRHLPAVGPTPNTRVPPPTLALWWHVKDGHVKDAAQDVAENVTKDVAEDVSGAAEAKDGNVKVLILPIVNFHRRNPHPARAHVHMIHCAVQPTRWCTSCRRRSERTLSYRGTSAPPSWSPKKLMLRASSATGVGAIRKQAFSAELRSNCRHELFYCYALEHHVDHLWLGILLLFDNYLSSVYDHKWHKLYQK